MANICSFKKEMQIDYPRHFDKEENTGAEVNLIYNKLKFATNYILKLQIMPTLCLIHCITSTSIDGYTGPIPDLFIHSFPTQNE